MLLLESAPGTRLFALKPNRFPPSCVIDGCDLLLFEEARFDGPFVIVARAARSSSVANCSLLFLIRALLLGEDLAWFAGQRAAEAPHAGVRSRVRAQRHVASVVHVRLFSTATLARIAFTH